MKVEILEQRPKVKIKKYLTNEAGKKEKQEEFFIG